MYNNVHMRILLMKINEYTRPTRPDFFGPPSEHFSGAMGTVR